MSNGFYCVKIGMTQIYNTDGTVDPVSVLQVMPHKILEKKDMGDATVQVLFAFEGSSKKKKKHHDGIRRKYEINWIDFGLGTYRFPESWQVNEQDLLQSVLSCESLDVSGISKGKGMAGVMKRHGFKGQSASHGNSKAHRLPGGMGGCQDPGRVSAGKEQAGHMGNQNTTVRNVSVVKRDLEKNLLFLKGSVPGNKYGFIRIRKHFPHGVSKQQFINTSNKKIKNGGKL